MIARLIIAALLSSDPAPDAGTPAPLTIESLYRACPDAPLAEVVDGGYFVPEARARRQTCQLAACESFAAPRLTTQESVGPSPGIVLAMTGGAAAVAVIAAAVGFSIGQSSAKK